MNLKWRDISLQYKILLYKPKRNPKKHQTHAKKNHPSNKQNNHKKPQTHQADVLTFFSPNMHNLLQVLGMGSIQQTWMLQILVEAYTLSSCKQQILLVRHRDRIIKVFKYHVYRIIGIKHTYMCY